MLCSSQSIKSGSRPCPRVWFPGQRMSDIASSIVYKFTVQLINQPVWRYFKIMQILCSPQNIPLDLNQLMILSWINISWDVRKMLNLPTAVVFSHLLVALKVLIEARGPLLAPATYLLLVLTRGFITTCVSLFWWPSVAPGSLWHVLIFLSSTSLLSGRKGYSRLIMSIIPSPWNHHKMKILGKLPLHGFSWNSITKMACIMWDWRSLDLGLCLWVWVSPTLFSQK